MESSSFGSGSWDLYPRTSEATLDPLVFELGGYP